MRHVFADDELRITRDRLLIRGAELRDRLQRVRQDLARAAEPLPRDFSDAAIVMENDEILQAIEQTAVAELDRIHLALERMEAGTFALCEGCGREIGAERLRAVPYANHCRHCEKD
jgi:RNA polymerase-binding transcription factor DksA